MTFNLNIIKKPEFTDEVTRQIKHDNGIELTICIKKDDAFNAAFGEVAPFLNNNKALTKDRLKKGNQGINANEAVLFLIGEYCVKEWNVTVDDTAYPINGENLLTVAENAFTDSDDLAEFLTLLLNTFTDLMKEFGEKVQAVQKKSSTNTNGKNKNQN
ncbi:MULTISPECIES: hypothetical protein [unclassified Moraxella]|uniref:hypothetical protein n=1 Tax=unclassified Moraxella TaxID=2685852 RepID=UPI002B403758|nr:MULTISPECIES: hypothetical protein [unclassified Moraxella]